MIARRAPMQRSAMRRSRADAGAAPPRRRLTPRRASLTAPRVKGRAAVSLPAWRAIVAHLTRRCGSRCEVPWCRSLAALQPHHVKPCSLGGSDELANILMVCTSCHRRFDAAFTIGRHVAEPLGHERFRIALEWRTAKRAPLLPGSLQEVYDRP